MRVQYGEFFNPKEIAAAKAQLALGHAAREGTREGDARRGPPPPARTVLGYRSRIDDSVQPYGLIVPDDWKPGDQTPRPLYLWFHGRGDTLSEVAFIDGRLKAKRDFAPAGAFELHLYGRWCNASKFAGETDAFEAMADVQRRYAIDPKRIAVLGFSMGGATAWHMGAHHAGLWAVVGAGRGLRGDADLREGLRRRKRSRRRGGRRCSTGSTTRRMWRRISRTCRWWPTAASSIRRCRAADIMDEALARRA